VWPAVDRGVTGGPGFDSGKNLNEDRSLDSEALRIFVPSESATLHVQALTRMCPVTHRDRPRPGPAKAMRGRKGGRPVQSGPKRNLGIIKYNLHKNHVFGVSVSTGYGLFLIKATNG
jgi:hypothetical protein